MRNKYLIMFILLLSMLFAIFVTGCTNQPSNEQQCDCSFCNERLYESFLLERDFPNFVEPFDRTVTFTDDELVDAFNFIAGYWDANPYCNVINAIEVLFVCVPHNRVRVGLDSDSEELKIAFRTHVLDSRAIVLEDVRRGMQSNTSVWRRYNRSILFDTEANRPYRVQLYNGQQECFTFAELLDTLNLVADFVRASRFTGQGQEIANAISGFFLCVINNRVIVSISDYSEEWKEDFRAMVTDSPVISFVERRLP